MSDGRDTVLFSCVVGNGMHPAQRYDEFRNGSDRMRKKGRQEMSFVCLLFRGE
jgi:hypothetical protein